MEVMMADTLAFEYDRKKLEAQAKRRGFNTVQEYLADLIEWDLVYLEEEEKEGVETVDVAAHLREAIRDVKEGRTYPIEALWDMVKDDDT
jgi:hypothetical protein